MDNEELRRIVDAAHRNQVVADMIRRYVQPLLMELGWSEDSADDYIQGALIGPDYEELGYWERNLVVSMPLPATSDIAEAMKKRAALTYGKVQPHLTMQGSVIDLGGGSGEIARLMKEDGHRVTIADVIDWRQLGEGLEVPFVPVRRNKISTMDESTDDVIALHVFHHSDDPEGLLREAFRVARRRVIFIESVTDTMNEWHYTAWLDWFYNRVIHYAQRPEHKIPVPCRFLPTVGWEQMVYRLYGLRPRVSENLGYYQTLNPLHHHLYVYDKEK